VELSQPQCAIQPGLLVAAVAEKGSVARDRAVIWIVGAGLLALLLKLAIAYTTFGTNDVVVFYTFARSLADHGLTWTYQRGVVWLPISPIFNHPPLTAYFLQWVGHLAQLESFRANGITFPFLLRFPGIIADFSVVILLLQLRSTFPSFRIPNWALALFALSPVSLMVSGFHGNTDPMMVLFLFLACAMCVKNQPLLCGLFFALSGQIKMIPLLLLPIFFFFWLARRRSWSFLIPFVVCSLICSWEPLLRFPALFLKNVFSYGSYWGLWGITYWLRLTGYRNVAVVSFFDLPLLETIIIAALKLLIIASVLVIAWRRRKLDGVGLFQSVGYAWIVFFVFSPGISPQYMIWLAPFVLVLSPNLYGYLVAGSSLFLFFFYNINAGGLPWYLAISTNERNTAWTPWSLWPWAVLIVGMIWLWRKARGVDPSLRLFSLKTLPANSSP
jgi:hypothetical protein